MRVALCLSGHVRTLMQTYPALSSCILERCRPDVFIHTWSNLGLVKSDRPVPEMWLKTTLRPVACRIRDFEDMRATFDKTAHDLYATPGPVLPDGQDAIERLRLHAALPQVWGVHQCDLL